MANSDDGFDSTMKFCTICRTNRPIGMFWGKRKNMVKDCAVCRDEKAAARRHEVRPRYYCVVKPAQLTMMLFSVRARRKSTSKPPIHSLSTTSPFEITITSSATACHAQTVSGSGRHHAQSAPRSPISSSHSARPTSFSC